MEWRILSQIEIIGPCSFKTENVTGQTYKKTLRYYAYPRLRNYPGGMIFQQDAAHSYYAEVVRLYKDQNPPNRGIWRARPILCPLGLSDLTPGDYFLLGYLNDFGFREPLTTMRELKYKISSGIQANDENTLNSVYENTENHL